MMLEKSVKRITGQITINSINMKGNCVAIPQTAFVRILNLWRNLLYYVACLLAKQAHPNKSCGSFTFQNSYFYQLSSKNKRDFLC